MSLLIFYLCLISATNLNAEDVITIYGNKPLHVVNEKFISICMDPKSLLDSSISPTTLQLARSISPAFVRFTSDSEVSFSDVPDQGTGNGKLIVSPSMWASLNDWIVTANLTPVYALNDRDRVNQAWNPKFAMPLMELTDKMNISCYWELENDAPNKSLQQYADDSVLLRHIQAVFPGSAGKWKTVGGEIAEYVEDGSFDAKKLLQSPEFKVEAINWKPKVEDPLLYPGRDAYRTSQTKNKIPLWITAPPTKNQSSFMDGLLWAKYLGESSQLGYDVVFRQPETRELSQATPAYWVTLLHKALMGRNVLDVRAPKGRRPHCPLYAHCAKGQNRFARRGALTIFAVNLGDEEVTYAVKIPGVQMKSMEIRSYVITYGDNVTETLLNGCPLETVDVKDKMEFFPKIRRAKIFKYLTLSLPGKSVGYFVMPNAQVTACIRGENALHLIRDEIWEDQNDIFTNYNSGETPLKMPELHEVMKSGEEIDNETMRQGITMATDGEQKQSIQKQVNESDIKDNYKLDIDHSRRESKLVINEVQEKETTVTDNAIQNMEDSTIKNLDEQTIDHLKDHLTTSASVDQTTHNTNAIQKQLNIDLPQRESKLVKNELREKDTSVTDNMETVQSIDNNKNPTTTPNMENSTINNVEEQTIDHVKENLTSVSVVQTTPNTTIHPITQKELDDKSNYNTNNSTGGLETDSSNLKTEEPVEVTKINDATFPSSTTESMRLKRNAMPEDIISQIKEPNYYKIYNPEAILDDINKPVGTTDTNKSAQTVVNASHSGNKEQTDLLLEDFFISQTKEIYNRQAILDDIKISETNSHLIDQDTSADLAKKFADYQAQSVRAAERYEAGLHDTNKPIGTTDTKSAQTAINSSNETQSEESDSLPEDFFIPNIKEMNKPQAIVEDTNKTGKASEANTNFTDAKTPFDINAPLADIAKKFAEYEAQAVRAAELYEEETRDVPYKSSEQSGAEQEILDEVSMSPHSEMEELEKSKDVLREMYNRAKDIFASEERTECKCQKCKCGEASSDRSKRDLGSKENKCQCGKESPERPKRDLKDVPDRKENKNCNCQCGKETSDRRKREIIHQILSNKVLPSRSNPLDREKVMKTNFGTDKMLEIEEDKVFNVAVPLKYSSKSEETEESSSIKPQVKESKQKMIDRRNTIRKTMEERRLHRLAWLSKLVDAINTSPIKIDLFPMRTKRALPTSTLTRDNRLAKLKRRRFRKTSLQAEEPVAPNTSRDKRMLSEVRSKETPEGEIVLNKIAKDGGASSQYLKDTEGKMYKIISAYLPTTKASALKEMLKLKKEKKPQSWGLKSSKPSAELQVVDHIFKTFTNLIGSFHKKILSYVSFLAN